MRIAVSRFLSCERSFWHWTTMPVGRCVIRTAESVLFTCWPPAPLARYVSIRRSASFIARGENAYGLFNAEKGVHRLVRISPYDAQSRRHTAFAGVEVAPLVEDSVDIEIEPEDLQIDTYRASGAGGQHVNKTDSAVRITHRPTGIVVQCQNERSQSSNRDTAMKMLRAKLIELEERKRQEALAKERGEAQDVGWGSQIRSYVLHPYTMVKDHRTNVEAGNAQGVLDGDLDKFVRAELLRRAGDGAVTA